MYRTYFFTTGPGQISPAFAHIFLYLVVAVVKIFAMKTVVPSYSPPLILIVRQLYSDRGSGQVVLYLPGVRTQTSPTID